MSSDRLWFLNSRVVIHRPSASSADGLSVAEHWIPFGDSPPLHVHHREDEIFHVLEGVVRFCVADQEIVIRAGQSALAPKGAPHTFRVESESGARVLVMAPGNDFEGLVRDVSVPAGHDGLPPPFAPTPAAIRALAEACERHGITILGPPMAA
ncbi:MAG: cupin domain-containing protein [Alphaproteobacteria bacterium]|nr:cupin domain-containing protein [Alphaproteobacteria bacterium]